MLEMLQQLQFTVRPLRQDRSAEGLHNLLDRNMLSCELILGRAVVAINTSIPRNYRIFLGLTIPYETKCSHANRLEIRIPAWVLSIRSVRCSISPAAAVTPHTLKSYHKQISVLPHARIEK
jgi:hypothetical protein